MPVDERSTSDTAGETTVSFSERDGALRVERDDVTLLAGTVAAVVNELEPSVRLRASDECWTTTLAPGENQIEFDSP